MPSEAAFGPWNPGIRSQIPRELLHLATIFRSENVFTSIGYAAEMRSLTGFALSELVVFRPRRLALHELLIRVTADYAVPDGTRIGDLGLNFREIARLLLSRYLEPHMDSIIAAFERVREDAKQVIDAALSSLGRDWGPEQIAEFDRSAAAAADSIEAAALKSVARTLSALFAAQGRPWGTKELIAAMSIDLTSNLSGSECIGRAINPLMLQAASEQGFRLLPKQEHPVVINTKGPSASGKSTLRPLLKKLAGDIGIQWSDFALISPDIWRKQLLDYSSLGSAYKYAGAFTSDELQIVDQKLDRYMANKHRRGQTSHLLIDRFRFDSFAPDSDEAGSNLLTRFGHSVYLFFMITPPEMLVDRAWMRGLEFGRYKAVDDTLAHAVEAYSGMPDVFFTWVRRSDKRIQFEFLDNSVRLGERPRTVAFGDNETFNVLDVKGTLDIQRYARIDEDAAAAGFLYADGTLLAPDKNTEFLQRCVKAFRRVNFADQASGRVYLRIENGKSVLKDAVAFRAAIEAADTLAGIRTVAADAFADSLPETQHAEYLPSSHDAAAPPTLGQWGSLA